MAGQSTARLGVARHGRARQGLGSTESGRRQCLPLSFCQTQGASNRGRHVGRGFGQRGRRLWRGCGDIPGQRSSTAVEPLSGRCQRPLVRRNDRLRPVRYREAARKLANLGCCEIPRRGGGSDRSGTQKDAVLPDWGGRDLKTGTLPHQSPDLRTPAEEHNASVFVLVLLVASWIGRRESSSRR